MNTQMMTTILVAELVSATAGATTVTARQGAGQKAQVSPATKVAQAAPASKVDSLVAAMTLDEKLSMLSRRDRPGRYGAGRLHPRRAAAQHSAAAVDRRPGGNPHRAARHGAAGAGRAWRRPSRPRSPKQFGQIVGRDARARHQNVVLAPMVNIVRVPAGRAQLRDARRGSAARRAASWRPRSQGIQGEGSIATVKHYAFNNQENARTSVSADVDEQTGREIDLPGFEAAVRAGRRLGDVLVQQGERHLGGRERAASDRHSAEATGGSRASSCPTGSRRTARASAQGRHGDGDAERSVLRHARRRREEGRVERERHQRGGAADSDGDGRGGAAVGNRQPPGPGDPGVRTRPRATSPLPARCC